MEVYADDEAIVEKPTMKLAEFFDLFEDKLTKKITEKMSPTYDPQNLDEYDDVARKRLLPLPKLPLKEAQLHVILAGYKHLRKVDRAIFLGADMGTGKTVMSLLMTAMDPIPARHVVMCPPHLVEKWVNEVRKFVSEDIAVAYNFNGDDCITKLQKLRTMHRIPPKVHEFYVIGRERAKNGYRWRHAKGLEKKEYRRESALTENSFQICPKCNAVIDYSVWEKNQKNHCKAMIHGRDGKDRLCGEPLWSADRAGLRRFAPAEFIKKHFPKGFFRTLLADELHELKGESAQGVALGQIAGRCEHVIGMTGTIFGGYADDIFYILWRAVSHQMVKENLTHGGKTKWVELYGVLEKVYKPKSRDNAMTRGMRLVSTKRRPGISPVVLSKFLLPNTLFLKLTDISDDLPPYEEIIHELDMDDDVRRSYDAFESDLEEAMLDALKLGDMSVMSRMLQALLSWPDGCRTGQNVYDRDDVLVASVDPVAIELTQKERDLISLVRENQKAGRKVLIYCEYTATRDIMETLAEKLRGARINPLILRSTVQAEKREKWIKDHMEKDNYDCMICNPKCVQTGLDLLMFPEIAFFQTGYSIFVLRQASRRGWRIGQTEDCNVHFFVNKKSMQSRAMQLVAKKLETALAIEGDLSETGLMAMSDGGGVGSMVLELARTLFDGAKLDGVENAWKKYRDKENRMLKAVNDTTQEVRTKKCENKVIPLEVAREAKNKAFVAVIPQKRVQMCLLSDGDGNESMVLEIVSTKKVRTQKCAKRKTRAKTSKAVISQDRMQISLFG